MPLCDVICQNNICTKPGPSFFVLSAPRYFLANNCFYLSPVERQDMHEAMRSLASMPTFAALQLLVPRNCRRLKMTFSQKISDRKTSESSSNIERKVNHNVCANTKNNRNHKRKNNIYECTSLCNFVLRYYKLFLCTCSM